MSPPIVVLPLVVVLPSIVVLPLTCNFAVGLVVPIPTFPLPRNVATSTPLPIVVNPD